MPRVSGQRIPDGFLDELKARLRPSDVIGRKVKLKKQGKEWVGLSPFTNEKTPSFYVNNQKGIFKCFSSGLGGDVIKFIQETERLSFMEAVEKLADEAGMALPKATPEAKEVYDRRVRLYEACEAACKFFETELRGKAGAEARQYLQGRGLHSESWGRHRLGFAPDEWRALIGHLSREGFSQSEIVEAGLAVQKEGGAEPYDRFRGRVIFPIEDAQGRVIAFGGRGMMPDAKPKYLNSSDTPLFHKGKVLYRYKRAREALGHGEGGGLIVCEGYMDAIALAEAGFGQAVAPLGTALTEDQLALLWRVGPEPVLCFDGDAAGLRAAYRSIDRALPFLEPGKSLFFSLLPEGMDPDDIVQKRGRQAMADLLEGAIALSELLWQRERDVDRIDTPERQAGLDLRLKQAARQIQNDAVRSAYERDLRRRMNDHFWQMRAARRGKSESSGLKADTKVRGLGLLVKLVESPKLLEACLEQLAGAHFPDPRVWQIRELIFEVISSGTDLDRAKAIDLLTIKGADAAAALIAGYRAGEPVDPDSAAGKEWVIALEHYCGQPDMDEGDEAGPDGVFASAEDGRQRHKKVAGRFDLAARRKEAADNSDV